MKYKYDSTVYYIDEYEIKKAKVISIHYTHDRRGRETCYYGLDITPNKVLEKDLYPSKEAALNEILYTNGITYSRMIYANISSYLTIGQMLEDCENIL